MLIGGWEICAEENKIRLGCNQVSLQPLCMSLLVYLSKHPGQVVERKELMEKVWKGRVVSEDALNNSVGKLRNALGDDPKAPELIETINKKGYRLIAKITQPNDGHSASQIVRSPKMRRSSKTTRKDLNFPAIKILFSTVSSLVVALLLWSPIKLDMVTISPEMTDQEKQKLYDAIKLKTADGGHIMRVEIGNLAP